MMKKILFLLFLFSTLCFISIYPQTAKVYIPLEVYDNGDDGGGYKMLYFGLDSTATDTIDTHLGEIDLPPYPPPGVFEVRFNLPPDNFSGIMSSYMDFRRAESFPYTDTVVHRLQYQTKQGADTMFFAWNFPDEVSGKLQDLITGTIVNVNMSDSGVYAFTMFSVITKLNFLVYYLDIIPVELVSFNANAVGGDIILNWITSTETNNKGFEVERSIGNKDNFTSMAFIPGAGTSTEKNTYSYIDKNVSGGIYYYRLKEIDYNGSYEYSNVVEVNIDLSPKDYSLFQNYPNPFNPETEIQFWVPQSSDVTIIVYDMIGREVKTLFSGEATAGFNKVLWDGKNNLGERVSSGNYLYKMKAGNFITSRKMVLLK